MTYTLFVIKSDPLKKSLDLAPEPNSGTSSEDSNLYPKRTLSSEIPRCLILMVNLAEAANQGLMRVSYGYDSKTVPLDVNGNLYFFQK